MDLFLFEDRAADDLLPLTHFRPVYDLRCGAFTLRERTLALLRPRSLAHLVRPPLGPVLAEEPVPPRPRGALDPVLVNGRAVMTRALAAAIRKARPGTALLSGTAVVAVRLPAHQAIPDLQELQDDGASFAGRRLLRVSSVDALLLARPWDLLTFNDTLFVDDILPAGRGAVSSSADIHRTAVRVRPARIRIGPGSRIGPLAVLDAENGPVIIGRNVTVMPGAVIRGPAAIGDGSTIKARAVIYGPASIGPACKIGGECDSIVIQGYSSKQHDGFLGHSVLGAWVNLGAGTTTSNLKNTYGTVRVHLRGEQVDTGRTFLGLVAGDHVKTGINTPLDTGTIIGPCAQIFGGAMPPKDVPAFSWGEGKRLSVNDPEKALAVARKVMARRGVSVPPSYAELFLRVFSATDDDRRSFH